MYCHEADCAISPSSISTGEGGRIVRAAKRRRTKRGEKPTPIPTDFKIDAVLVERAVAWTLEKMVPSTKQQDAIKICINEVLAQYTAGVPVLTAGAIEGAEIRSNEWIRSWKSARPKLHLAVLSELERGHLADDAPFIAADTQGNLKLLLKPVIKQLLHNHAPRLVEEGELDDVDSARTIALLTEHGLSVLGFVACYAREAAASHAQMIFVNLVNNTNCHFRGADARGAGVVFNAQSRWFVQHAIDVCRSRCEARLPDL